MHIDRDGTTKQWSKAILICWYWALCVLEQNFFCWDFFGVHFLFLITFRWTEWLTIFFIEWIFSFHVRQCSCWNVLNVWECLHSNRWTNFLMKYRECEQFVFGLAQLSMCQSTHALNQIQQHSILCVCVFCEPICVCVLLESEIFPIPKVISLLWWDRFSFALCALEKKWPEKKAKR